ncbi:helix-turn-helix transcriptional regulator [Paenibacillus sp. KN14-4R]|uniref:helix-turn-helix transcriptional regulator n=1 Tax=Paenibacillus sp. KN14-4R TaxID=3445773 RepID=UPI003FA0C8C9
MKLERMLAITLLLLNQGKMHPRALAEHFHVSIRTIYRDLDIMEQAGIPLVFKKGASGGYELQAQYRRAHVYMSIDQLHTLIHALRSVQPAIDVRYVGRFMEKVKDLIRIPVINNLEPEPAESLNELNPWNSTHPDFRTMNLLRQATLQHHLVQMRYTDAQGVVTIRRIEPMALVLNGYEWYMRAFCRLRQGHRIFVIARIEEISILDEKFSPRTDQLLENDA